MYNIIIPKLHKQYSSNCLKVGLMVAIAYLNRDNGKLNKIIQFSDRDLYDCALKNNKVACYTQYGDQILVERIEEVKP